jgi:hypothetical protein
MRLIALLLFAGLALAQGPPITINQTQVNGGIANDCLKVNSNKTLGQATCGGGGGGSGTVTSVATSNGLTGGTITTSGTISGINAAANGTTKGVSAFTAADFDASAGVISLDYTNGQKASGSQPGFLSSADWTTFNNKGSGTVTGSSLTANLPVIGAGSSAIAVGTRTGNTTQFASWTGATTASRCVHTDASGNLTIASGDCGVSSGDVVGPSSATDNAIARFDSTTGKLIQNSTVIVDDSGNTTLPASAVLTAPGGVSTGTSPPSVTAGTGGAQGFAEGTVPSVCAASAVDCVYADSTQHGFLANFNNVGYLPIVQGPASWTTARVVSTNGTNGGKIADAGFLAADVVRAVAPGAGICHFAGSTQVCTSSAVSLTADVSGVLPTANIAVALANQTSLHGITAGTAAGDATFGQVIAHGATALDFASTSTGACATVIQATATGAVSTDVILFNANASIKAVTGYVPASTGGFSISTFPTADKVNFEACNWTAGTVDPGSITVNWVVIR